MRHGTMTRWGRFVLGGLLGCVGVAALVTGLLLFQNYRKAQAGAAGEGTAASAPKVPRPVRVGPDSLEIPPEVVRSLDIRTAPAAAARISTAAGRNSACVTASTSTSGTTNGDSSDCTT